MRASEVSFYVVETGAIGKRIAAADNTVQANIDQHVSIEIDGALVTT
jgi:hypothetical protein